MMHGWSNVLPRKKYIREGKFPPPKKMCDTHPVASPRVDSLPSCGKMHFFRNRNRPRSSFDIQVGRSHLLEVTVHLVTRRRDASHRKRLHRSKSGNAVYQDEWDWYEAHKEDIHAEFLELLEASVLSRMFGKQLEGYHRTENPSILPRVNDDVGGVASKNKAGGKNRKRKGPNAKKQTHKKQKFGLPQEEEDDKKPEKDIYFSFGQLIQLAYKKEPIGNESSSHTILFRSKETSASVTSDSGNTTPGGSFRDRRKLPDRLLVWISQSDAAAASEGGSKAPRPSEGMYRPEMIPISSLFRKPKDFEDFSDNDDD